MLKIMCYLQLFLKDFQSHDMWFSYILLKINILLFSPHAEKCWVLRKLQSAHGDVTFLTSASATAIAIAVSNDNSKVCKHSCSFEYSNTILKRHFIQSGMSYISSFSISPIVSSFSLIFFVRISLFFVYSQKI